MQAPQLTFVGSCQGMWVLPEQGLLEQSLVPAGPSRVYAAQEKAVLQEFHFILKKVSDRVLKKTAQEVEQTAVAKATASAALAAVPGNLLNHPSSMPSPAPSPRMQQPPSSPFPLGNHLQISVLTGECHALSPGISCLETFLIVLHAEDLSFWRLPHDASICAGVQQSPGQMRVLHIAQSPHGARPAGAQQMPQQRMVNLSAYGRPGGELAFLPAAGFISPVRNSTQRSSASCLCGLLTRMPLESS